MVLARAPDKYASISITNAFKLAQFSLEGIPIVWVHVATKHLQKRLCERLSRVVIIDSVDPHMEPPIKVT